MANGSLKTVLIGGRLHGTSWVWRGEGPVRVPEVIPVRFYSDDAPSPPPRVEVSVYSPRRVELLGAWSVVLVHESVSSLVSLRALLADVLFSEAGKAVLDNG